MLSVAFTKDRKPHGALFINRNIGIIRENNLFKGWLNVCEEITIRSHESASTRINDNIVFILKNWESRSILR